MRFAVFLLRLRLWLVARLARVGSRRRCLSRGERGRRFANAFRIRGAPKRAPRQFVRGCRVGAVVFGGKRAVRDWASVREVVTR